MLKKKEKVHDIIDILEKFGKYQVVQYILICLPTVFITMININYIFVAGDLDYRCRIPKCDDDLSTVQHPNWWPNISIDRCSKPVLNEGFTDQVCSNTSFSNTTEQCTEWIYESTNTVVAELNLACQPWKSNLIGTIHCTGMLFSMIIAGWMSDRFGRKPTIIFSAVGSCIGHLKTFVTSYYIYVTIEFVEAAISSGSYAAAMVLMLEIGGQKNRILSGVLFAYAIYLGETIFATIAMFVPYWKTLIRIMNSPSVVFISYIYLVKESPRWQIVNGKINEAKETMAVAAKMNNINVNFEDLRNIDGAKLKEKLNIEANEKRESFKEIFASKVILIRLLVASFCRFTSSFVYYGLMINSVWLPGNKYTNFLLSTLMSFPGELMSLYLMNKVGRKLPLMVGFITCGALCVASAYVPASFTWTKISFFLVGKIIIAVCFTGAITYTMELYPTSTRGSLLGLGAFASRLGGLLAPLTPILNTVSETLPPLIFGASAIITGALITLTPETKDLPLMDTIQQVEDSVKNAKKKDKVNNGEENLGYGNDDVSVA